MSRPVIAKLETPRAARIIRRSRVLAQIERALRAGHCWLAAPAGYGKTTALLDYLRRRPSPHVWYRIDEGDQDIASFFHYLSLSLPPAPATHGLPVFGAEYADQPIEFARRYFRAYFAKLPANALLVLDDLHYADVPALRAILAVLLCELPGSQRCVCLSRTLPPKELAHFVLRDRLIVIGQAVLEFSEPEARALVATRQAAPVDVAAARGWAIGLVLLTERGDGSGTGPNRPFGDDDALFDALGGQLFDHLPQAEQDVLLRLSLLPEITIELALAIADAPAARALLDRLQQRQLLVTRTASPRAVFRLHDLLRDFLGKRLAACMSGERLARLRKRAALALARAGHAEDAIEQALLGRAWTLARRLIATQAEAVLAQGRRETLIDWCGRLPEHDLDPWLCYWLGVAHMADDDAAETWLARAWSSFSHCGDLRGECLTIARAVLAKTDSWRTHQGLSIWTQRASALLDRDGFDRDLPGFASGEQLLVLLGLVRALDFSDAYRSDAPREARLAQTLLQRLSAPRDGDSSTLRLQASEALIERAGSTGQIEVFEQAVDCVLADLRDREASPWALGMWLVAFGSVSGRYFPYSRHGFPYVDPEDALRAAIAIGEREGLRGVEFGALYHLQLQLKARNDFAGFSALIDRLSQIADSRYSTQVAVLADCQAALYTTQGRFADAYEACERFNAAIEAANEPPIERWPHYLTQFQVLLADRKPLRAARLLEAVLPHFDGGVRQRTLAAIAIAHACAAKWSADADYPKRLHDALQALRAAAWPVVLLNLPELLAQLCADALELDVEAECCRALIARRRLQAPPSRPAHWQWELRIHVLGDFRIERDGIALNLGAKAPVRSLDILRALAISKDHTCALETLHDRFWPDADGDQAKAACEQALHRLRKLLGSADMVLQREGKLRLAMDRVWLDLDDWESRLKASPAGGTVDEPALEQLFLDFTGPLLASERPSPWVLPVAERLCGKFLDLAFRVGAAREARGDFAAARGIYLHALDFYPESARLHESLIRNRLGGADTAAALEAYSRYRRMLNATVGAPAAPAIQALIEPLLHPIERH